jgi:hypothetical protein
METVKRMFSQCVSSREVLSRLKALGFEEHTQDSFVESILLDPHVQRCFSYVWSLGLAFGRDL